MPSSFYHQHFKPQSYGLLTTPLYGLTSLGFFWNSVQFLSRRVCSQCFLCTHLCFHSKSLCFPLYVLLFKVKRWCVDIFYLVVPQGTVALSFWWSKCLTWEIRPVIRFVFCCSDFMSSCFGVFSDFREHTQMRNNHTENKSLSLLKLKLIGSWGSDRKAVHSQNNLTLRPPPAEKL